MRISPLLLAAAVTLGLTFSAPGTSVAQEASYSLDASHSNVGFKVRHNVISWVTGHFTKFEGTVKYDPKNIEATAASVTIDATSIDTEHVKRDEHLRSPDFFDTAAHPTITFVSTGVRNVTEEGGFDLVGNLTMHGVTRAVTLSVEPFLGPVTDGYGNTKIGTTASVTIDRQDFGVSWSMALDAGGLVVGDDVRIVLELELNQAK